MSDDERPEASTKITVTLEIRNREGDELQVTSEWPTSDLSIMRAYKMRWLRADRGGSINYSIERHPDGRVIDSRKRSR